MARVIRGEGAQVVPAEVVDAKAEAARIVAEAEARALAIAKESRAALAQEAREAARAELAGQFLALERARDAAVAEVRGAVGELAVGVARRVLGEAFEADPHLVRRLVDEALERLRRANAVTVTVHPDDVGALDGISATVIPDPELARGDCVVSSELGELDGRIEVRLDALAKAIADASE